MEETIKMRGDVAIRVIDVTQEHRPVVESREIKNLIVKGGKRLLCLLLAGAGSGNAYKLGSIGFGTGAAVATITDTGLGTQIVQKAATPTTYLIGDTAYNQIKMSAVLLSADNNGNTFKELGLFTADGTTMFSRLNIGDIAKSVAYEIQVDWIISFQ